MLVEERYLLATRPRAEKFITAQWAKAFRATMSDHPPSVLARKQCDLIGCTLNVSGTTVTHLRSTQRLDEDCLLADILVIPFDVPQACSHVEKAYRPTVLDRGRLFRTGSQAIHLDDANGKFAIKRSTTGSCRPWDLNCH